MIHYKVRSVLSCRSQDITGGLGVGGMWKVYVCVCGVGGGGAVEDEVHVCMVSK